MVNLNIPLTVKPVLIKQLNFLSGFDFFSYILLACNHDFMFQFIDCANNDISCPSFYCLSSVSSKVKLLKALVWPKSTHLPKQLKRNNTESALPTVEKRRQKFLNVFIDK